MRSIHPVEWRGRGREPCERSVHLLLLSLLLFPACSASSSDVKADDGAVLFTGGRLSWSPDEGPEPEGDDPCDEGRGATFSFDLDISFGAGQDSQRLEAGQVVVFGGRTITGPTDFMVFGDLTRVLLDARLTSPLARDFSVECFGGLEYSSLDVDVRTGSMSLGVTSSDQVSALGPAIGVALVWEPHDALRFSAVGRFGAGWWPGEGTVKIASFDVGLGIFPVGLGLFVGWRSLGYENDASSRIVSGLNLQLSGPVIAPWIH